LGGDAGQIETWRWLSETVLGREKNGFRGRRWGERRNKVKQLASLVREGPEGVLETLKVWQALDADLDFPPGVPSNGFFDSRRTPLLDAVELVDIHLPLVSRGPS